MSAVFAIRRARTSPSEPTAPMNCVPLTSERPSFAWSRTGSSPARVSASAPGTTSPSKRGRPLADERKREMGEGREISRGADRTSARHDGQHSPVQTLEEQLDRLDPRAREAFRERVRAEHHRGADDLVRIRLPHPARVASQEPELELLGELRRDRLRDEAAEAGVDAVGVLARRFRRGAVDELAGRGHLRAALIGERGRRTPDRDRPDVVDREIVSVQEHCGGNGHRGQV